MLLDAGSLGATTWYYTFAIGKTTGETAFLASLSATAPTMPSGYTLKRRIGSFKTDGSSHILAYAQTGDLFQWGTMTKDVNTALGASGNYTLNVPALAVMWQGIGTLIGGTAAGSVGVCLFTVGQTSEASTFSMLANNPSNIISADQGGHFSILTNASQQIAFTGTFSGGATAAITLTTTGWIDRRGRDD